MLNVELRIDAAKGFAGVTFVDAGNIFPNASDLNITDLRPAAGFGVHYKSPIGPVRVELGFNLAPRELVPGVLERGPSCIFRWARPSKSQSTRCSLHDTSHRDAETQRVLF